MYYLDRIAQKLTVVECWVMAVGEKIRWEKIGKAGDAGLWLKGNGFSKPERYWIINGNRVERGPARRALRSMPLIEFHTMNVPRRINRNHST